MEDRARMNRKTDQSEAAREWTSQRMSLHNHRIQINFDSAFLLAYQSSENLFNADAVIYIWPFTIKNIYVSVASKGILWLVFLFTWRWCGLYSGCWVTEWHLITGLYRSEHVVGWPATECNLHISLNYFNILISGDWWVITKYKNKRLVNRPR